MRRTADAMLLVTVLLWGFNFTVSKYVLTHGVSPLVFSCLRFGLGAAVFCAITYRLEGSLTIARRDWPVLVGAALSGIWLNQITFMYGLRLTSAATGALIMGTLPVVTGIVAWLVRAERPPGRFWIAAVVAFGGVAMIALGSAGGISGHVGGDLLILATALTWGIYSILIVPLMRRYSPYRISAVVLLVGYVPLFASGASQVVRQDYRLPWLVWVAIVFGTFGPLVLTNVLWFRAVSIVGPSRATLFVTLQPFVGAFFALVLLHEGMGWLQVAGGTAIAAGLVLSRRRTAAAWSSS